MLMSLLLAIFITFSHAAELVLWKPSPSHPGVILAAQNGQTPEQAVQSYWQQIQSHPELLSLLKESGYKPKSGTAVFIDLYRRERPIVALLANEFSDYTNANDRTKILNKFYSDRGYDVFVVGLAATSGLSRADAREFRSLIAHQTELLFALGGDDVSPKLYNEKATHARGMNMARDKEEVRIIYDFKRAQRGFFVGICRGHQLGAVTDGHTLYQDLQKDGVTDHSLHRAHRHGMQWGAQAKQMFSEETLSTAVNSLHHQAVRINTAAKSAPIGFSTDGVVEALSMNNGKGVSFQFHPEYMAAGAFGANYAQVMSGRGFLIGAMELEAKTRQPRSQACRRVYK